MQWMTKYIEQIKLVKENLKIGSSAYVLTQNSRNTSPSYNQPGK